MLIIGCDYHPGFQQIAFVDTDTGELRRTAGESSRGSRAVLPGTQAARCERYVWGWKPAGTHAGLNDCCETLQFELWIGDAAEIRTKRVRKQKTDRQDAQLLLRLMMEDRFPRIWVPDAENRDHAATAVASASIGADAHAGDESIACGGTQRRPAAQEGAVAAGGSQGTGVDCAGSVGQADDAKICSTYSIN